MSFTVTDAFVQQFTGNVRFLAQQTKSRLADTVITDNITGESAYMEQVAPTAARKKTSRHSDTPIMNTQHLRRRIVGYSYEWGDLIDRADKVRLLIDPTSTYAQNASYAMERSKDDEIIGGYFATAYTGHAGATAVTWPNGNSESAPTQPGGLQVAVNDWTYGNGSGNVGLTISKLISASVALDAAEGDEDEERFIVVAAKQKGNLLATTEATNADYAAVKALTEGKIDRFMGFTFRHSERLQTNASGYTRVPAYRQSAMGLGIIRDIEGQIGPRPDKSFSTQVFTDEEIGAARLEEAKLVEIICL
jgi:hypothetical protein